MVLQTQLDQVAAITSNEAQRNGNGLHIALEPVHKVIAMIMDGAVEFRLVTLQILQYEAIRNLIGGSMSMVIANTLSITHTEEGVCIMSAE